MGMDLFNTNGDCTFYFNNVSWIRVLSLAELYWWEPAGTLAPERPDDFPDDRLGDDTEDWCGTYASNDGQIVTAEDAANLANALEKSLDDIPDHFDADAQTVVSSGESTPRHPWVAAVAEMTGGEVEIPNIHLGLLEYFGGQGKQTIKDFIGFCRSGSFAIH